MFKNEKNEIIYETVKEIEKDKLIKINKALNRVFLGAPRKPRKPRKTKVDIANEALKARIRKLKGWDQ